MTHAGNIPLREEMRHFVRKVVGDFETIMTNDGKIEMKKRKEKTKNEC